MKKNRFHISFNLISDPNWHAGNIYIFNCIRALNSLDKEIRKYIFISVCTRKKDEIPKDIIPLLDEIFTDTLVHLIWYKILRIVPAFLRLSLFNFRKIDFYYPAGNLPKKWIFNWGGWIPDFQDKHLPHLFSPEELDSRNKRNIHLASESNVLAFSSMNAIEDYHTYFPEYKGNEFLLHFVSKTDPEIFKEDPRQVVKELGLPDKYFIVCNQFWKHKDHGSIIKAMGILKRKDISINVVCTGSPNDFRNPDYFPSLQKLIHENKVEDNFFITGFISRNAQIQLIRKSMAVIQPSLFEGWSTVVEDARSLGKTIFLSNIKVHLEQNPPYVHYFEKGSPEELANLIEKHLNELSSGPDLEKEKLQFKQNQELMNQFGINLLKMAGYLPQ